MHHLRLMALLQELVRTWGCTGTARVLEIDPRTVTSSMQSGQLTHRVRSDKLEARMDKLEAQLKEMKENLRSDLKGLRMSLDGVRKYYGVQRRLIEQRLLILEAGRDGAETGVPTDDGSGGSGARSVATGTGFPGKLTDPTLAELVDAGERTSGVVE